MTKIIVANWKMNGDRAHARAFAGFFEGKSFGENTAIVCPSFPTLGLMNELLEPTSLELGAQDLSPEEKGAFTGDVSGIQLYDTGARYVLIGHSERRQHHGETSELLTRKLEAARRSNLTPIFCVGESLAERESGLAFEKVGGQLRTEIPARTSCQDFIVAYEPIWAIGTGLTPTLEDIQAMHDFIKETLEDHRGVPSPALLYGGSVTPENAEDILRLPHVDGVLVGGASLKAESFEAILKQAIL